MQELNDTLNTVAITPQALYDMLTPFFEMNKTQRLSLYIEGEAGTGKTYTIKKWGRDNNVRTITKMLSQVAAEEIAGVSYIDRETRRTVQYFPEWLPPAAKFDSEGNEILGEPCILFLDELNHADSRTLNACFSLIQFGTIGQYQLPSNVMVISAGNPPNSNNYVTTLPEALNDRFTFIKAQNF